MDKIFNMNFYGDNYQLVLTKNAYINNKNLYLGLFALGEGPFSNITVNIDKLPANQAAVDVNNCPWAEDFITENKLGVNTGKTLRSGFCTYPVYEFDMKLIDEIAQKR